MKLGSKVRYAVMAIVDVAQHSDSGAVPLADVAARQKISLSYLEQLFAMLRRGGVVVSARGPGGGYRLARPARETTIRAIFDAVEDPAGVADDHPADGGPTQETPIPVPTAEDTDTPTDDLPTVVSPPKTLDTPGTDTQTVVPQVATSPQAPAPSSSDTTIAMIRASEGVVILR